MKDDPRNIRQAFATFGTEIEEISAPLANIEFMGKLMKTLGITPQ